MQVREAWTMKSIVLFLVAALLAACSSSPRMDTAQRLALYRGHAGEPVSSFRLFGQMDGWTSLGDGVLVIWTRPKEAWLLELTSPCNELPYATAIALTGMGGVVHARTDSVLPLGSMVSQVARIPCRIGQIRPLDTRGLRAAQEELRKVQAAERGQEPAAP
jgi:hypothetical protein